MKNLLLFLTLAITLSTCKSDDDTIPEIDKLPAATQTGEGTFGCLVNGEAFVETGSYLNCYYQYVDGEYYFSVGGNDENLRPWSIFIQTNEKQIYEGTTYQLLENESNNATAGGGFPETLETVYTNENNTGELTITKLNFEDHIVSGTFWFNIEHPVSGEIIEIREGRFDTLFTQ